MARPSVNSPGEHDKRVPASTAGVSQQDLETRLVLQKRQKGHLPDHDHPEPLPLVIQGQNNFIHGQVSVNFFYYQLRSVPFPICSAAKVDSRQCVQFGLCFSLNKDFLLS